MEQNCLVLAINTEWAGQWFAIWISNQHAGLYFSGNAVQI